MSRVIMMVRSTRKFMFLLSVTCIFLTWTLLFDSFHNSTNLQTFRMNGFCNVKNFSDNLDVNDDIQCVHTDTDPSIDLCIHSPERDIFVSKRILAHGHHEKPIADAIVSLMQKHPSAGLLDLGANIGKTLHKFLKVFSILPAWFSNE